MLIHIDLILSQQCHFFKSMQIVYKQLLFVQMLINFMSHYHQNMPRSSKGTIVLQNWEHFVKYLGDFLRNFGAHEWNLHFPEHCPVLEQLMPPVSLLPAKLIHKPPSHLKNYSIIVK